MINDLAVGGAETVLYRLATYPAKVEHEIICIERRAAYSEQLERAGIPVHHLDWTSLVRSPAAWFRLLRLIRQANPDVVQTWMYRSNIVGGLAARRANVPVVWNIRCSSVAPLRLASRILARVGGYLAGSVPSVIVNCSAASAELHKSLGYDAGDVVVIQNGYDPGDYVPDKEKRLAARDRLGIDADTFLLGSIGRWDSTKGYPILLEAASLLARRGVGFQLLLIGPGLDSSNDALSQLVDGTGCRDFTRMLGYRVDVPGLARALDVHVLASVTEGFPNVIAETMLAGTPNVATDVGDSALIVAGDGWIVPPGDAGALCDAMARAHAEWSDRGSKWRKRQEAGRRRVADTFGMPRMVGAYERIWSEVARRDGLPKVNVDSRPSVNGANRLPGNVEARPDSSAAGARPGLPERSLRVLHIINDLSLGGAETLLSRVATSPSPDTHIVVSLGRPAWYSSQLQANGLEVHHLDMESVTAVPKGIARLRRILRESRPDVVQCWMYRSNVFGGVVAKTERKPVVWGIHCASIDALRPSSRALAHLSGMLARWTPDFVINCSNQSAELHRGIGYSKAPGGVIHNGYDASVFFPDEQARRRARRSLGLDDNDFAIGSITRWDSLKDIPNLLAALRIASDRGVPFHCFLIGTGLSAENGELEAAIEGSGCGGVVRPLGRRSDIEDIARALDLHVLASRTEAFPSVVAETMLSGTPNAVTEVGDASLMVGETGWLVPPGDPERLADAIVDAHREWMDDPVRWQERRKAGRRHIAENFSFDSMIAAYERLWAEIAQR